MLRKTVNQDTFLNQNLINYKAKVTIQRNEVPDSVQTDITSIIDDIKVSCDLDRRNATCQLLLNNKSELYTPKNRESFFNNWINPNTGVQEYNPLIYPNHKIRVWFYLNEPSLNDPFISSSNNPAWQVFTGVTGDDIDIDTEGFTINLSLRDKSKELQDTYIELSTPYEAVLAEDLIHHLLTTYLGNTYTLAYADSGVNLDSLGENYFIVETSTNYLIEFYQIKDSNLWDSIQKIADLMGWVLRFNGKGQLLLHKERENVTVSDYTITPDYIISDSQGVSDADIRNDIVVKSQNQNYDLIEARFRNEKSISDFGWRPMIASLEITAFINTFNQAFQLARAICRDLSFLREKDSCGLPLLPFAEVGDIIDYVNPRSYTGTNNTELYKVMSHDISYSANQKRSSIQITKHEDLPPSGVTVIPQAPTGLNSPESDFITKEEYVYDDVNGAWTSTKQVLKYPKLKWNPVTQNTDGTMTNNLSAYTIYRKLSTETEFKAIGSVRAYYQGNINSPVTYFIDYGSSPSKTSSKTYQYKITAVNSNGTDSAFSTPITVIVPQIVII